MSTVISSEQQLEPSYNFFTPTRVHGRRQVVTASVWKKEAVPGDKYSITIPKLVGGQVILPDTMCLIFNFENSNDESWFRNNLGKLLVKELQLSMSGHVIYVNDLESMLEVYKDLWKSDKERAQMLAYGIADEDIRKIWSGESTVSNTGDNKLLAENVNRLRIKLGKVFDRHGPLCTHDLDDIRYDITLPKSDEIMEAASGKTKGKFKLTDVNLAFEVIKGNEIYNQTKGLYDSGRTLNYNHVTHLTDVEVPKGQKQLSIGVNVPRRRLQALVVLFREEGEEDAEVFANANIEKVKISIEGVPNVLFSEGLQRDQIYSEAKRFFGSTNENNNFPQAEFYNNKCALVIDMRNVPLESVVESGRKLVGTQAGLLLDISREATAKNLSAKIFVISDATVNIRGRHANAPMYQRGNTTQDS